MTACTQATARAFRSANQRWFADEASHQPVDQLCFRLAAACVAPGPRDDLQGFFLVRNGLIQTPGPRRHLRLVALAVIDRNRDSNPIDDRRQGKCFQRSPRLSLACYAEHVLELSAVVWRVP